MSEITQEELQAEWDRRTQRDRENYIKTVTLYKLPQDNTVYMGEPPENSLVRKFIDVIKGGSK